MTAFTDRTLWRAAWQEFRLPWRWGWHLLPLIYVPIAALGLTWQVISEFKVAGTPLAIISAFLLGSLSAFVLGRAVPTIRPRQRRASMLAWIPIQVAVIATAVVASLVLQGSTIWGLGLFLLCHGLGRVALVTLDSPRVIVVGMFLTLAIGGWVTQIEHEPDGWNTFFQSNRGLAWCLVALGSGLVVISWYLDGRTRIQTPGWFLGWTLKPQKQIPKLSRLVDQRHLMAWWHDDLADAPRLSAGMNRAQWLARWRLLPLSWGKLLVVEAAVFIFLFLCVCTAVMVITARSDGVGMIGMKSIGAFSTGAFLVLLIISAFFFGWLAAAMACFHYVVPFASRNELPRIVLMAGAWATFRIAIIGSVMSIITLGAEFSHHLPVVLLLPLGLWILMFILFCHGLWLGTVSVWIRIIVIALVVGALSTSHNLAPSHLVIVLIGMLVLALVSGIWLVHYRLSRWEP